MINACGKLLFQELECRTFVTLGSQETIQPLCPRGLQAIHGDDIQAFEFQGMNVHEADKKLLINR